MADSGVWLIDTETGAKLVQPPVRDNEVFMPEGYSWTWCLDARIEPYDEMDLDEVRKRGLTNRKRYLLVKNEQVGDAAPDEACSEE